jgi:2-polyprenyl-3-methyl-5-hydroxy-6-metoxy-1,4-benzoquinol methylase
MDFHGQCLLDFYNGDENANYTMERDDGYFYPPMYAKSYFHLTDNYDQIEQIALDNAQGLILDLGAGAGSHSLYLQKRGFEVHSVDVSKKAVEVMAKRGVSHPIHANIFEYDKNKYDTILIIFGIGIVGNLNGLNSLFINLNKILKDGGSLFTDSIDVHEAKQHDYHKYHKWKEQQGRYFGERKLRIHYNNQISEWFDWMHADKATLKMYCEKHGFHFHLLKKDVNSRYIAKIVKKREVTF